MLNVGYVALRIAEGYPELLDLFQLNPPIIGALAALHDVGKISPGFQRKCEAWLKETGLLQIAKQCVWDTSMESDHGKATHAATQTYFNQKGVERNTGKFLSTIIGGHHGRLSRPEDPVFRKLGPIIEQRSGINWEMERNHAADEMVSAFAINLNGLVIAEESPVYWWLAGLTSVADWIGSDERYFPAKGGLKTSEVGKVAERCLEEIGWGCPPIVPGLSFHDLFCDPDRHRVPFKPNAMQKKTLATITQPGVYVIEAPMGMGKTEAALAAAYQLLEKGKATGIYFALPTQATSNRMHIRMANFVKRISPGAMGTKLVHGNSWLKDERLALVPVRTAGKGELDAREGRDWFSSAKRALLAPFGVGTVDQALLGIVAAKHFFVRHFALAGKVVILDEIHSYDLYTGKLIDKLIETLEKLGCTVIVLSATLSGKRREQIVSADGNEVESPAKQPYPLITGKRGGEYILPVSTTPTPDRKVEIIFKPKADAMAEAVETARAGGCVVWICNTVDNSQRDYRSFVERTDAGFPLGLLHARFPFWRREELEEEWMNRLGKDSSSRCGSLLVSTQIVEQSVDLDADLMITELAPTDMLLQRMGRLWRHDRKNRPVIQARLCVLEENHELDELREMKATEIVTALGGKAHVYDPYVLLRSLEVWRKRKTIRIPSGVRNLIEATYKPRNREPASWRELDNNRFATDSGKKMLAARNSNLWQIALEDEEGVQTRLNEVPTRSLVLCRSMSESRIDFIDGTSCALGGEKFNLMTAQGIHRNLVKIPDYCFAQRTETLPSISRYLRGPQAIGYVKDDDRIAMKGLKDGIVLRWDINMGVIMERTSEQEDE